MAAFADGIFNGFGDLVKRHRFVPAKTTATKALASLVRHESEDVFVYVMAIDFRSEDAEVEVNLWVAPPDEPDDGLASLGVGFKTFIASTYKVGDEFLCHCQERIERFLKAVPGIVPVVLSEYKNPSFKTERWTVYRCLREAAQTLYLAAEEGDRSAKQALEVASRVARGKGTRDMIEDHRVFEWVILGGK